MNVAQKPFPLIFCGDLAWATSFSCGYLAGGLNYQLVETILLDTLNLFTV